LSLRCAAGSGITSGQHDEKKSNGEFPKIWFNGQPVFCGCGNSAVIRLGKRGDVWGVHDLELCEDCAAIILTDSDDYVRVIRDDGGRRITTDGENVWTESLM
jgi:hypothetical protein